MATITTRSGKGSPLTNTEVDDNFTNLNTAKYESGSTPTFADSVTVTSATAGLQLTSTNNSVGYHTGYVNVQTHPARGSHLYLKDDDGRYWGIGRDYSSGSDITHADFKVSNGTTEVNVFTVYQDGTMVVNQDGASVDFRVETSSQAYAFFIDDSSARTGMYTSTPNATLGVYKTTTQASDANPVLRLQSGTAGDSVLLRAQTKDSNNAARYADIAFNTDDTNETIELRAPYNTTSPQITISSDEGVVFNEGGLANRDFRVEGDTNINLLKVDAGDNVVSVAGTSAGAYKGQLQIGGNNDIIIGSGHLRLGGNGNSGFFQVNGYYDNTAAYSKFYQDGYASTLNFFKSNGHITLSTFGLGTADDALGTAHSIFEWDHTDAEFVFNGSARDHDFRVSSDDVSHMFFVDGAENKIGVNAGSSPNATLHVGGNLAVNGGAGEYYGVQLSGGEGANPKVMIGDWHNASATLQWNSTSRTFSIDAQYGSTAKDIYLTGNDGASTYAQFNDTKMVLHTRVTHSSSEDTLTTTNNTQIAQWSMTGYESAKAVMTVTQGSNRQVSEILITHDGSSYAYMTEYAVLTTNGTLCEFSVGIDGANFRLLAKPVSSSSTVVRGVYQSQNS